jgi:hypothetical protein
MTTRFHVVAATTMVMILTIIIMGMMTQHQQQHHYTAQAFTPLKTTAAIATKKMKQSHVALSSLWSLSQHDSNSSINGGDDDEGKTKTTTKNHRIMVVGNGMVGQRFMENLLKLDTRKTCTITTFCEEPRAAYNRVKLTSYFETRNPSALTMTDDFDSTGTTPWYENNNVEILIGEKITAIDPMAKTVTSQRGTMVPYDICVMATGSIPFVPPIPGRNRPGVFVYRTIEDLENMLQYVDDHQVKSAAVIGGGLLGLEAAKAAKDMGLESHIIEFADILVGTCVYPIDCYFVFFFIYHVFFWIFFWWGYVLIHLRCLFLFNRCVVKLIKVDIMYW